ncbi:MAG: ADP-glyceromanno-heptose 6-epimerase [Alphaproteobacteria bacterium]|nr:ADP-glyceromanno-heptose 6-epimerase [Alphaproteobacteria bacterium]
MIIVTGGAGFIGSNLVAGLEQAVGGDIVVVDRLGTDEKWRNIAKRELAAIVPPEDFFEFLERHRGDVETVFHLGAISATTERDADLIVRENITLPLRLWHWCAENRTRLIYASSAATYGDGSAGFDDDDSPEGLAALRPMNAYGWSKHAFDRRAIRLAASGVHPPQWVGLKFFNVYGPNEYHKGSMKSVVAQITPKIMAGESAKLFTSHHPDYPDGGQLRDFVYVDDCVRVMLWLLDAGEVNGVFNLGTGAARSFADLARSVFAALDQEERIEFIEMPEAIRDRYQYFTQARMDRLRGAGYPDQFTTLEEGVRRYVKGFLTSDDPYR